MRTLLIIPGHIGKDSGAVIENEQEQYINLQQAISTCCATKLFDKYNDISLVVPKDIGHWKLINVIEVDLPFTINKRISLANSMNANVIEIHNNASNNQQACGSEVLCFSQYNESGTLNIGYLTGQNILKHLEKLGLKNRGVKPIYDRFKNIYIGRKLPMLINTRQTSIIVETGFMSNKNELSKLDVDLDGFNEQVGLAIALGIKDSEELLCY